MTRIAIATCRELPEPDVDEELLSGALRSRGADPVLVAWDSEEPRDDWDRFDLCVIRSTWSYWEDPARFTAWLQEVSAHCPLWNSLEHSLWNLDKRYLTELEGKGIEIVPTRWVSRGATDDGERELAESGWNDFVIKPTISAGSVGTRRFRESDQGAAREYLRAGLEERDWMVQKYCSTVETSGERAIVIIDGEVSHSVRKNPRFTGDDESVSEALVPSDRERGFAERVLSEIEGELLYGRVDVIADPEDAERLFLAELELLEPSLFLKQHPPALDRFADAIVRRARS